MSSAPFHTSTSIIAGTTKPAQNARTYLVLTKAYRISNQNFAENNMKEFIITFNSKGSRKMQRIFAYNSSDAVNRLKQEHGSISVIKKQAA